MSIDASNGPRRTDFAQGYSSASSGCSCGERVVVVVVVEVEVEVEFWSGSMVVDVDDEVGTVDEVAAGGSVVVEEGTSVVGGRIVSPGVTVLTGFEVEVESPEAERRVESLEHEASTSPATTMSAAPLRTKRRVDGVLPFMAESVLSKSTP